MKTILTFGFLIIFLIGIIFTLNSLFGFAKTEGEFWQKAYMCSKMKINCHYEDDGEEGYHRWLRGVDSYTKW